MDTQKTQYTCKENKEAFINGSNVNNFRIFILQRILINATKSITTLTTAQTLNTSVLKFQRTTIEKKCFINLQNVFFFNKLTLKASLARGEIGTEDFASRFKLY